MRRSIPLALVWALLALVAGCGAPSGPPRYELSGTVTWNGQPVPFGSVMLIPDAGQGNRGPASVARVLDGKFVTLPSHGVVGGAYRVQVTGYDGQPVEIPGEGISQEGSLAFPAYEQTANLPHESSTLDIVVPSGVER